jgi:hypothetical protein
VDKLLIGDPDTPSGKIKIGKGLQTITWQRHSGDVSKLRLMILDVPEP